MKHVSRGGCLLINALKYLEREGYGRARDHALFRLSEWKNERYFSANTKGDVFLRDLGFPDEVLEEAPNEDTAIPYSAIIKVLQKYLRPEYQEVFVDYGCGKGRALLVAGLYPFKKVVGVELSPELSSLAKENLTAASSRFVCEDFQVLTKNATDLQLPSDATVLHFYNPFQSNVLEKVVGNIRKSLEEFPRDLLILYANPFPFERLLNEKNIIPREWIREVQAICWPYFHPRNAYGNTYRIYKINPQAQAE